MPWLTPEDIPEDDICRPLSIPADTAWMSFFSGALTELTKTYNWEQFGALSVEDTVQKMQEIVNNYFSGGCSDCTLPGGYRIIRINTAGHLEELTPEGEWQETTGDYDIPEPEARAGGTPEEQICLAAKNAVNVLEQLYESLSDSWNANLTEAEAVTAFAVVATGLMVFEFAPITAAIVVFFLAAFKILYFALSYLVADYWDASFTAQMVCFLQNCATNAAGVITFDYECFMGQLNSLTNNFGLSENQIMLYLQVGYILYFIGGMDGLNLAGATDEINDTDCSDCDCVGTSVNFAVSDQGFVESAWETYPACGQYITNVFGTGWYFDSCSGANWVVISGDVETVCGNGININGQVNPGPTPATMHIRITTPTQVKNVTYDVTAGPFTDTVLWDEGGILLESDALVQIAWTNPSGYGGMLGSFQTGNI